MQRPHAHGANHDYTHHDYAYFFTLVLTYFQVLGQLKSVAVILGGWLLFAQYYPPKAVGGAAAALVAMVWYTHANLAEQELSAGASAAAAITALATPGSSPSSSTASLEEGEVLLQSRHKRSGQGAGS